MSDQPAIWPPPRTEPIPEMAHPVWYRRPGWLVVGFITIGLIVLIVIGSTNNRGSKADPARYNADRSFCEDRASNEVLLSGGLYSVGGTHWASLVNDCLVTRATDR